MIGGETGLVGAVGATHRADSERNGGIRAGCPTTDENRGDWRGRTANEKKQRERKRKKAAGDGAFCSRGLGIAAESAAHRHNYSNLHPSTSTSSALDTSSDYYSSH